MEGGVDLRRRGGHLQATGIDAAGRKQYLYHPRWRERRDREKFARMERFGRSLPAVCAGGWKRTSAAPSPQRERVLACAVRLLDVGLFRVGSEAYAEDDHGVGLATVRKDHVTLRGDGIVFDYPGQRWHQARSGDRGSAERRARATAQTPPRGGPPELLAYRAGRRWVGLRSERHQRIPEASTSGEEFSAKDFRTWNATVLAAVSVGADAPGAATKTARKRAIDRAVRGVSEMLGNTPAVARRSYIDPRVFDRYLSGWTIAGALGGTSTGSSRPTRGPRRARAGGTRSARR